MNAGALEADRSARLHLTQAAQELLLFLSHLSNLGEAYRWVGPWRINRSYLLGRRLARAAFAVDPSLRGDA